MGELKNRSPLKFEPKSCRIPKSPTKFLFKKNSDLEESNL